MLVPSSVVIVAAAVVVVTVLLIIWCKKRPGHPGLPVNVLGDRELQRRPDGGDNLDTNKPKGVYSRFYVTAYT